MCTVGMQSRMEALQGELLERILSDLQDIKAVLWQCLLVSKAWREAVSRMYPRDLELPNTSERRIKVTPEKVLQLMQWLQGKHAKGYFGQLENLTLMIAPAVEHHKFTAACLKGDLLTAFLHSTMAYLNFWHLQSLKMHGRLRMETILPVLPTNLRHLSLEPDASLMPMSVSMAVFAPYTRLESLTIAVNDTVLKGGPSGSFILDTALPTLQNLSLDPWPFLVDQEQSVIQCLPRVQNLAVHVFSTKAQSMLALSSLQHLSLILHDVFEPGPLTFLVPNLQVPHDSQLQKLLLAGPPTTPFCLDLTDKPSLLEVVHVAAGRNKSSFFVGRSQYSPPENFNDLSSYFEVL